MRAVRSAMAVRSSMAEVVHASTCQWQSLLFVCWCRQHCRPHGTPGCTQMHTLYAQ